MPHKDDLNDGYEYREELGAAAAGCNVVEYLAGRHPSAGRGEWLERIEAGRVLLDGAPAAANAVLRPGQRLSWLRPPWVEPDAPLAYAILHRDEHLLAVAKPTGLPTLPGGGRFMRNTLWALVRRRFPEANPVHRLGRGTSGVLLFARSAEAFARVSQAWRRGEVRKAYRTLVAGEPSADGFDIDVPVGRIPHRALGTVHAATFPGDPSGKAAHSHVAVMERRDGCALVDVRITTGRPHQIRIHLAAAGHPLVGDPLYGVGGVPLPGHGALPGDLGYHLHSLSLELEHPATGERLEVVCAPPPPLRLGGSAAAR
ncbi:MAG: RluA family pseudouridine synthase [Acidobacteriota bacterium]|jgi:23S rRNA pseudouridine1911/1915/1917 synthase|nr:RluA family pseudouridine synthase [Acidobacteriota bacterium]